MPSFKFLDLVPQSHAWHLTYIHCKHIHTHSFSIPHKIVPSLIQKVSCPQDLIIILHLLLCYVYSSCLKFCTSVVLMLSASQKGPAGWWWWSLCLDVIGGPHYGLVNGHNRRNHCLISAWLLLDSFLPKLTRDGGVFLNFTIYWQAICSR